MGQANRQTRGRALFGTVQCNRLVVGSVTYPDDISVKTLQKTITTAQVKALNATPIELVAAPGAGKYLVFLGALIELDYASAAYAGIAAGEDLVVKYENASGAQASVQCETTGFLDATADAVRWIGPLGAAGAAGVGDVIPAVNKALVLHLLVGEVITGDSPLKLTVYYRTIASQL